KWLARAAKTGSTCCCVEAQPAAPRLAEPAKLRSMTEANRDHMVHLWSRVIASGMPPPTARSSDVVTGERRRKGEQPSENVTAGGASYSLDLSVDDGLTNPGGSLPSASAARTSAARFSVRSAATRFSFATSA